ncbi:MAG: histidine kinase, partial [Paenibacillus sp.]|nr:histidine kinase [Paenibacillus sp.]
MRLNGLSALHNMSFKRKLLISYLLLIIIPISILGLFAYDQSRRFLQRHAMQSIDNTTRTMAGNLDDKIERYRRLMDSIVFNVGIQKLFNSEFANPDGVFYDLKDYFESTVSTIIKLNEEIVELTVFVQDDMPEYGSYIRNRSRVEMTNWYRKAVDNFDAEWFYEQNQLIVARKLLFQVNKPSVVSILLNEHLIFKSLWSAGTEDYGVVIEDRQGKVIYYRSLLGNRLLQMHETATGGAKEVGDFIVLTEPIPSSEWTAHFYIPKRLLASDGTNIIEATVIIIIVCFSFSLLLIWIFSNTMIRPIQKLNRKMEQVENGDLSVIAQSHASDEIG